MATSDGYIISDELSREHPFFIFYFNENSGQLMSAWVVA